MRAKTLRHLARRNRRRGRSNRSHATVAWIETLQARTLLSGTSLNVSLENGTLFVRDTSDSHSNNIQIEVLHLSDSLRVIDQSAEVIADVGTQISAHEVEVPLNLISTHRVAVYGGAGDDNLTVETAPDKFLAFSFSGGDGVDAWTVNGTPQDDNITVVDEPKPGEPISNYVEITPQYSGTPLEFSQPADMVVDDANERVFLSSASSEFQVVSVFDFDGNRIGTINNVHSHSDLLVHDGLLYAGVPGASAIKVFDSKTLTLVNEYPVPVSGPGLEAIVGDRLILSMSSDIAWVNLKTGEYHSRVAHELFGFYSAPYIASTFDGSGVVYMANVGIYNDLYAIDASNESFAILWRIPGFGQVEGMAASTDGQHVVVQMRDRHDLRFVDTQTGGVTQSDKSGLYSFATSPADGGLVVLGRNSTGYHGHIDVLSDSNGAEVFSIDFGLSLSAGPFLAMSQDGTRIFVSTNILGRTGGRFHVIGLPERAAYRDGIQAIGVGDDVESLVVIGGHGNDVINSSGLKSSIASILLDGGNGNDDIRGGELTERIAGGNGQDTLLAGGGEDTLLSGLAGDDFRGRATTDAFNEGARGLRFLAGMPTQLYQSRSGPLTAHSVVASPGWR